MGRVEMIEISGLNKNQVDLLDCLWSLDTQEQVDRFIGCFDSKTQKECRTLMTLVSLACLDQVETISEEVKDLINRVR